MSTELLLLIILILCLAGPIGFPSVPYLLNVLLVVAIVVVIVKLLQKV